MHWRLGLLSVTALLSACGRLRYAPWESAPDSALETPDASLDAPVIDALLDAPTPDASRDALGAIDAAEDAAMPPDAPSGPCDLDGDFGAPTLLAGVSTPMFAEATMRLSDDEQTGYLWSTRLGNIDLARVTFEGDTFSYDETFTELNTDAAEFEPTISRDGLLLVYRGIRGGTEEDLYFADRSTGSGPFTSRGPLPVNSASSDRQPFLADTELLFVSDRGGASRIYRASRSGSTFGTPVELRELAVAGASDQDPVLAPDGLTLYFASDRDLGDVDIFVATRPTTSALFGTPRRLPNVNSSVTDGPSWVSRDHCRLYMSSARAGTPDVYMASRPAF